MKTKRVRVGKKFDGLKKEEFYASLSTFSNVNDTMHSFVIHMEPYHFEYVTN